MARRKKSSKVLERAERRIASLRSISSTLNVGEGLTIEVYTQQIEDVRTKLAAYNTALSVVDQAYNATLQSEQVLADLSEHMLLGVATKYGKSSDEYEMAGGVRKTDRKRGRGVTSSATRTAA